MITLRRRLLGRADELWLRDYWSREPEAHIFAVPDLDHFGWYEPQLDYTGWFDGDRLVGALMTYGSSAQWGFDDPRVAEEIAPLLARGRCRFVSGLERYIAPVLEVLGASRVEKVEPSIVAELPPERIGDAIWQQGGLRTRRAMLSDVDALAALHVSAPDQFNNFDYPMRRRILYHVLTDGWRRVYLAESPGGVVVAAAQSNAEGREIAVVGGVVTHPEWRGRGYATRVTAHLCRDLVEGGMRPYLYYRRDNVPAARVYEKLGFVPRGEALLATLEWES